MILWDGSCMVHEVFSVLDLIRLKKRMPDADDPGPPRMPRQHPRAKSDFVGGTEAMLRYVGAKAEPADFLVATEANMLWQLQNAVPRHRYHPVPGITCACNKCPHMARNTLETLRDCLKNGGPEIPWQPEFDRATQVLQRSLLELRREGRRERPPANAGGLTDSDRRRRQMPADESKVGANRGISGRTRSGPSRSRSA